MKWVMKKVVAVVLVLSMIGGMQWGNMMIAEAAEQTAYSFESISAGDDHSVGLKSDGTVLAAGKSISGWTGIVQVTAGSYHTLGLKSNKQVIAHGYNSYGECNVTGWTDIVQVSAGTTHSLGLKSNGTVVAVGSTTSNECNVSSWTNIVQVSAGTSYTVGLKTDGTVVAVGSNSNGQCNVSTWTNIVQVSAGTYHTVGLKSDGTVVAIGANGNGECNVSGWTDIIQVSAGNGFTVGLRSNGTVVAVGNNNKGQCDVNNWVNIVQISAGNLHSLGLKSDGTVVAGTIANYAYCAVGGWSNIKTSYKATPTINVTTLNNQKIQYSLFLEGTVNAKNVGDIMEVKYRIDGGATQTVSGSVVTSGAFTKTAVDTSALTLGAHTVSVWVEDGNGLLSDIKTINFTKVINNTDYKFQSISAGNDHTVGLKKDGTVVAVGNNSNGQCNVSSWTNIVQVSAGYNFTIGLKADGTVLSTGLNNLGQCNISSWTDIVQVATGNYYTLGLKKDGTVVSTGYNYYGQSNVGGWTNIIQISSGSNHSIGLESDGTVVATGYNNYGQCNVSNWSEIIQISSSNANTVGLKSDGTVVAIGNNAYNQCNVSSWIDVAQVLVGDCYSIGLKANGSVVSIGQNGSGQCNVTSWTNIVQVSTGQYHTVALKSDETVVATGNNSYGQCNVSSWTDIKTSNSAPTISNVAVNKQASNTYLLTGTVSDADIGGTITVKYNIDGGETQTVAGLVTTSGDFTSTVIDSSALSLGNHTLNAWAIDSTGRQSSITSTTFNVDEDTINPKIDSVTISPADTTIDVHVVASDANLSTEPYIYIIDGQASLRTANSNYTFSNLISNKKYIVEVQVYDSVGNFSTYTEEVYTGIQTPIISVSTIPGNQLQISMLNNTSSTLYQIMCNDNYLNALGQEIDSPIWITLPENSLILEDPKLNEVYEIKAKAKDKQGVETEFCDIVYSKIEVVSLLDLEGVFEDAFRVISKTGKEVQLSWDAPIDAKHIKRYELYRNGELIETTNKTTFTDRNLDYATAYLYEIRACDTSDNVADFNTPLCVITLDVEEVSKISAGEKHSLMLKSDGTVWAWGANESGQLGNGTTTSSNIPIKVNGLDHIINIFTGQDFNLALQSDGTVWAWGENDYGQLGIGSMQNKLEPIQVKNIYNVISISVGDRHSLFLTSNGEVWGSGYNGRGQLGDGTILSKSTPVQAIEITEIKSISAGGNHSLAIKQDGTVWTWGENGSGQLGDSTTTDSDTPIQIAGLTDYVQVEGGSNYSLAIKEDGTLWAWGENGNGTLGDGTTTDRLEPVLISTLEDVIDIDAGSSHSIARTEDKRVWVWGSNTSGELGNGTSSNSLVPIQVTALTNVEQIEAGYYHNFAITTDQNIWSWGKNDYSQLGNKSTDNQNTPDLLEGFIIQTVFNSITEVISDTTLMINWPTGADTATYELEINNNIISSTDRNYVLVSGLAPKTIYNYRIRLVKEIGTTDWSELRTITTYAIPTPIPHEGIIDETMIEIMWEPVVGASSYKIEVDGVEKSVGIQTHYVHMELEQNTTHKYKVRAISTDGTSSWSQEISVNSLPTRPESPTDLKAFVTDTVVKLTWTAVPGVIGYDLEIDGIIIENGTDTTYEYTDLDPYSEHTYRIRSRSELIEGLWSDCLSVYTLPGKPKAPEKIGVSTVGTVSTISWEEKPDNIKYEIEVNGTVYDVGNNTTYTHRNIDLGVEQVYRIRSVNKIGTSDWSGYVVNNSIRAISTKKKELELGLTASNITDFGQYELTVFYNKDVLKVKDICAKTSIFELNPGYIQQEGITIKSVEPGKITFVVEKDIELGYDWTGIVNNIIFDGQVSGGTTIDYTVYIIPE